ncbi:MAG: recombinase RecT [Sphingobium sp.]|jgi:recombination protein RecT|nr:recombinase RecT [Sphingobium sp.]
MSQTLRNIQKSRQGSSAPSNVVPFPAMLEQFKGEIARALPKHLSPDRMVRIALTAFRMNPKLAQTDPRSVFAAVIQSSQLGLEVGLMGEAHLVPFGSQCQLIPGYQGLMKLARNSGIVQDIYGHEVRINDKFDIVLGLNRTLVHEPLKKSGFPSSDDERGTIVGFYAVAVFKDGTRTFHAMSKEQIEQVRDNSRGYQMAKKYGKESPWDTHFIPMGLKTVIRRLCNLLPKSPELAMALAMDDVNERGETQNIGIAEAIEGSWAPIIDDETGEVISTPSEQGAKGANPERSASGKLLQDTLASIGKAVSTDELDEVYVRAEGSFEGAELEQLLRAYRSRKTALANPSSAGSDIFGEEGK